MFAEDIILKPVLTEKGYDGIADKKYTFIVKNDANKTALVVMDNDDVNVIRAAANLPKLETLPLAQLSTYEVVVNNKIVMTKAAVEKIQEVNA